MTKDDVHMWLHGYVDAWITYDPDRIEALFAEDVQYRYPPLRRTGHGSPGSGRIVAGRCFRVGRVRPRSTGYVSSRVSNLREKRARNY